MADYVDGFVFPISRKHVKEYHRIATAVAEIWLEHGALEYREYVGEDLAEFPGTRSFLDTMPAGENETIVFGWVGFSCRDERDAVHDKVARDPRMAKLMSSFDSGFDAKRMAYGGFESIAESTDPEL